MRISAIRGNAKTCSHRLTPAAGGMEARTPWHQSRGRSVAQTVDLGKGKAIVRAILNYKNAASTILVFIYRRSVPYS
jgi:hypothetical protein